MGYYTRYSLTIEPAIENKEDIKKFLMMFENEGNFYFNFNTYLTQEKIMKFLLGKEDIVLSEFDYGEDTKWYEHEEEMKAISKALKGYVFSLYGEGEETGDMWVKYFKNGGVQTEPVKIEFDSFDESKLIYK